MPNLGTKVPYCPLWLRLWLLWQKVRSDFELQTLVDCWQVLQDAVLFGVIPVVYEFEGTSLEFLLSRLDICLRGRTARYIHTHTGLLTAILQINRLFRWKIGGKFYIHRILIKRHHRNLWPGYDLRVVRHDVALCEVNWWRFVTLFR